MNPLARWVQKMGGVEVGVIGDLIADLYVHTRPSRLSREAPVLIVRWEREELIPGGAANTARNLAELGVKVRLVADVGTDPEGAQVVAMLGGAGVDVETVMRRSDRPTVTKTRILAGDPHRTKQQQLRIDREPARGEVVAREADTIARLERVDPRVHAWVVSDYDYDLVSPPVIEWLRQKARSKPVIVDSRHRLAAFRGVGVLTPNEEEAEEAAGLVISSTREAHVAARKLLETLGVGAVLLTRGKHGMVLCDAGAEPVDLPVVGGGEVVDVSGAGDTVVAAFTAARLAGAPLLEAAWISNCAASVVVMKVGAATCSTQELLAALERAPLPASAIRRAEA
jgi:rfaE bifunctional protein kinase chain/domain